ncbi:5-oxoprolinase subunit PxpB [Frateuria aurantia]
MDGLGIKRVAKRQGNLVGQPPDLAAAAANGVVEISALGTTALLLSAPGELCLPTQQRIWALAEEAATWAECSEAVPGMNNLMLCFRQPPADNLAWQDLASRLQLAWHDLTPLQRDGRIVELAVSYGGTGGPHLADVVEHTGLSVDQVVQLHTAPLYQVYALGSHPGYCYLGGMDPRIATPRRASPIINLPGGSVSIGGVQTGVSASAGPSGWNTIGHTEMMFFDPRQEPPAVMKPGDLIRFRIKDIHA